MVGRDQEAAPKQDGRTETVKHDLHSAGLDSINAAQLVYDRPQWKAFVCGLPTLEPEHGP